MSLRITKAWVKKRAKELGIQADDQLLERMVQRLETYRQAEEKLDSLDLREVEPASVFSVEEGKHA